MQKIWIFAETDGAAVHASFYELLTKARSLYQTEQLTAVVIGSEPGQAAETLKTSGVDQIICAAHEKLGGYHPDYYVRTLTELGRIHRPDVLLMSATAIGSEVAPTVAARFLTGLAAHCSDLCLDEHGGLTAIIPAFGGKLLGEILIPEKRPAMATVKPGVFERKELPVPENVEIVYADTGFLDDCESGISLVDTEELELSGDAVDKAEVVVCAGLGIGSQENWDKAQELAQLLGGSLGYTRPAVDMGYAEDESSMIGTSGKMVRPGLYIGFGVSGAAHHVCGMKDSKLIISVNKNEKADIFHVSDYKLVADSGEVLDELLQTLKNK